MAEVSTATIVRLVDPSHSPQKPTARPGPYLDDLIEGRGQWEGRGIRHVGIEEPILLTVRDGKVVVANGHHRLLAAMIVGLTTVPVLPATKAWGRIIADAI